MQEVEWLSIMWGHIFTLRWNRSRQPGSYPVFLLSMVSIENCKFYFKFWTLQRMSRMTEHVSKASKVDPGDRVTLPVKFACKQELTLTRLLG